MKENNNISNSVPYNEYEISILICTYNPQREKLFETISSILRQDNIYFQIIISDDGSAMDYFEDIKQLFEKIIFCDYKLVKSKVNKGTVHNLMNAISACDSDYIKVISPGDMLFSEKTLRKWLDAVKAAGREWSFGDAVYYRDSFGRRNFLKEQAHPKDISPYLRGDFFQCRVNYVINNDNCLGAAILLTKRTAQKYLNIIIEKITYSEDNMFWLLMLDGVVPLYYHEEPIIYYEYGTGISTSGNKVWSERMKAEGDALAEIILNHCEERIEKGITAQNREGVVLGNAREEIKFAHHIKRAIKLNRIPNKTVRCFKKMFCRDMLLFFIRTKLSKRTTPTLLDYK